MTGSIADISSATRDITNSNKKYNVITVESRSVIAVKDESNVQAVSHNIKSAIWFYEFSNNRNIDSSKSLIISPNTADSVAVNEQFSLDRMPQSIIFATTSKGSGLGKISQGPLEITNPGMRYSGVTNNMELIIHSNGDFLNGKDEKSIVPVTFTENDSFKKIRLNYANIGDRSQVYVASYDESLTPACEIEVFVDGEPWPKQKIESEGSTRFLKYQLARSLKISTTLPDSTVHEFEGETVQELINGLKQKIGRDLSNLVLTISKLEPKTFDEKVTFEASDIPEKVVFDLDSEMDGTIEFETIGIIVSGVAPNLTVISRMDKETITNKGIENSYLVEVNQDNPFKKVKIYYDDIFNSNEIYPAKFSPGANSGNFEIYIENKLISANLEVKNGFLSFVAPRLNFIFTIEEDDDYKGKCDAIHDCVAPMSSQNLDGKAVIIRPIGEQHFSETVRIEFESAPSVLKFNSSEGKFFGSLEIINKGIKITGTASEMFPILHIDQSTLGDSPDSSIKVELEASNSFSEITFKLTGIDTFEDLYLIKGPEALNVDTLPSIILFSEGHQIQAAVSSTTNADNTKSFSITQAHYSVKFVNDIDSDQVVYGRGENISHAIHRLVEKNPGSSAENNIVKISREGATVSEDQVVKFNTTPKEVEFLANSTGELVNNNVEIIDIGILVSGKLNSGLKLHNTGENILSKDNETDSYVIKFEPDNQITSVTYNLKNVSNIDKIYLGILTADNSPVPLSAIRVVSDGLEEYWSPAVIETIESVKYVTISKTDEPPPNQNDDLDKDKDSGNKTLIIGVSVAVVVVVIVIIIAVIVVIMKKKEEFNI